MARASDEVGHLREASSEGPRWPIVAGALGVVVLLVASRIRRLQSTNAKDRGRSRAETK